ncbi:NAD(P)/FAD-dependent oxidoreductase [Shimia ponticola]|uniref:NAD(P)/FAD-dependent oxidoreductase n=1 Tax=Shimia ponticola TaxID=2582893 RepID=UPI0011BEDC07|nr:FAD-dependent oxidoreductase [Shimia ponticola]
METYDFVVLGRGLMGSACARWVAESGATVALIGPDEPADRASHAGPFASHHDAARITRRVSHDPVWSDLSAASIERYRDIEQRSGLPFFHPVGGMMAGRYSPGMSGFTKGLEKSAETWGAERMTAEDVRHRYGFALPDDAVVSYEPNDAGWIDPRAMREAQEILAVRAGATVIRQTVTALQDGTVTLADGTQLSAGQVVVATGGYARTDGLLPARPAMRVYARTVAFAEVAGPIPQMPTLIWVPEDVEDDLYLLPPVKYPDGRWLIKIGGEIDSPRLETNTQMTEWFQSAGGTEAGARLVQHLRDVVPDVEWSATHAEACAVSFTATGYPYIARMSDRMTILTGGNGAGAKCADELGRLGSVVARGGDAPGFEAVFDDR